MKGRIREYTKEVLSFHMESGRAALPVAAPSPEKLEKYTERCLRIFRGSGAAKLLFFGLGSGWTMNAVSRHMPSQVPLAACELSMDIARLQLPLLDERWEILADMSPWAHLCLLGMEGFTPENTCLMLNPELPAGPERTALQALQRLFAQARLQTVLPEDARVSMSAGCILSPDEPQLDEYFSQFPGWLMELCIVWDAPEVPEMDIKCPCPVRQTAHPLDDFASQRNRMKEMCAGQWLLYLDGDECFRPEDWDAVKALVQGTEAHSFLFTRQTLYPDEQHAKIGFGLWPDLQQRLFRNLDSVRFKRPIHEKLTGLDGPAAIVLNLPIKHYSRIRKSPDQIMEKLSRFDRAARQEALHRLNEDYPSLNCPLLVPEQKQEGIRILLLPANSA